MGWFVAFSGSPLYTSTVVISPQTETRFIREQYQMLFDGPGTMTMTPRQTSCSQWLSVYSEESVPLFGPTLPNPPIFKNHQEFREFLLVKLINGEKAAFNTPTFAQKRERTLDMLIKDLYTEHMAENRGMGDNSILRSISLQRWWTIYHLGIGRLVFLEIIRFLGRKCFKNASSFSIKTMLNRRAFSDVLSDASKTSRRKEEARQVEFVRIGQALKLDTIVKGDAPTSLATTSLFKREPWEPQCFYPDFPHEIVCGDSWGDNKLVLATEDGVFFVEEGSSHRLIFDKSLQVKQLSVVEAHGILLLRADKGRDSRIHVFRLSDFEGEQNENLIRTKADVREHKIERTKGCHLYALSRPGGSHLRMVVALGRKLIILQWRHSAAWTTWCAASDTDTVDGFQFTKEISVPDTPQLITLVDSPVSGFDNQICVGYRHQFDLVNEKTGESQKLHVVEGNKGHLIAAIDIYEDDEAELLLCYNHMTHFQKLFEEGTTEFDFQWNAVPEAIDRRRAKITDVAREFDIAHSVVSRLWKSFKTTGMCSRRHGGGRVRSTTPAEDRYIVLSAKRNRRTTAQQVANQFLAASGKQISRKTVARRLRGGGLYARRPVVCVPLTRQHHTARLQWSREHHNWAEQDWACLLFSDESRFSLSSDCRRQLIWRESGAAYRPENIQEKDRYPTCSIMVWADIMINGRTRLHVVANGTMAG
ncbi:hypothetical protein TNCV_2136511 [Trichonephila clavipes]|nr:hypothetical protein TNCV_2136511 [Trichonephila clavipes]